ncbi:YrbL family protein [Prosthecochloris sp. HL-130-GSB]|jgi:hypothetical protein|uniref:PhoP regulatory network protein YrbL n=1 Tax=Prosthecochloris aestuarii TaxID=1102 RepID=A0A831SSW7_PROAE|nr:YrbL family protein [Prosthecochloris sp. HL-130-GSB]MBO8091879.1 hypothetical protein [Prosthecochloris sp.]HED31518.1 hypothetical protein [Prosthecochloris aestuarii]
MDDVIIKLDDSLFLGKGSKRICYLHPRDKTKCIKFDLDRKRGFTVDEVRHYRRYRRRGVRFDVIAPYYGQVETDAGTGYVFGIAYDYDGMISKDVSSYLRTCNDEAVLDDLFAGMASLKRFMVRNAVMTTLIEDHNMVYQRLSESSGKVVLIDGIGNNQFLPSANYVKSHARRVIKRKWHKYERKMITVFKRRPAVSKRFELLNEKRY